MAKPDTCPVCDKPYDWRVPSRYEHVFHCWRRYRHSTKAWVYLHRIDYVTHAERLRQNAQSP